MMRGKRNTLVIGAFGQVGTELTTALRDRYGTEHVVAADIECARSGALTGPSVQLDCTDAPKLFDVVSTYRVGAIYHLAALLSATAETKPQAAWHLNVTGLQNVLEVARFTNCQVFVPSSIAAFGPDTPRNATPQTTIQRPSTLYGITKVTGELLCDYYAFRYGLDVRGVRFPGLISTTAPPGGGTTDFAVELLRAAAIGNCYTAPLAADMMLDMMYMPDAVKATLDLMQADPRRLRHRNAYNVTAFSLSPTSLAASVTKLRPDFKLNCAPNPKLQAIADSWPNSLDDTAARSDWGWQPDFDLDLMTAHALDCFAHEGS